MHRQRFFVLPFILIWGILFFSPILLLTERSFNARDVSGGYINSLSFAGWAQLLSESSIVIFKRSIIISSAVSLCCLVLAVCIAILLRTLKRKLRKWLLFIFFIPLFLNSLIFSYGYILLLSKNGPLYNALLYFVHTSEPQTILFTPFAVGLGMVSTYFGFCFFPIYAGLLMIELRWSLVAADLGASPIQVLRLVTLPLLRPVMLGGGLMVFIPVLSEFLIPDILGGGRLITLGNYVKLQFTSFVNWPYGSAIAIVMIIMAIIVQLTALWVIRKYISRIEL